MRVVKHKDGDVHNNRADNIEIVDRRWSVIVLTANGGNLAYHLFDSHAAASRMAWGIWDLARPGDLVLIKRMGDGK